MASLPLPQLLSDLCSVNLEVPSTYRTEEGWEEVLWRPWGPFLWSDVAWLLTHRVTLDLCTCGPQVLLSGSLPNDC